MGYMLFYTMLYYNLEDCDKVTFIKDPHLLINSGIESYINQNTKPIKQVLF